MKKSPHRLKHEQSKAIRAAQQEASYAQSSGGISDKTKKTYLSSKSTVKIAKAKASSKHKHHMTSPDEVGFQTAPASIHQEGDRWMKVIQKQTLLAASRLQKRLQKLRFFKGKK